MTKTCGVCGSQEKHKRGNCAPCARRRAREWYKNNRQRAIDKAARWQRENPKKAAERNKRWRDNNPEKVTEYRKRNKKRLNRHKAAWKKRNPDKVKKMNRAYRRKNKAKIRRYNNQYRKDNPQIYRKATRKWRQNNLEKRISYEQKRRAIKSGGGGEYTVEEWRALCKQYDNCCLCCGRADVELTVDHVIPISMGGRSDIGNIQPLCQSCNSKKGANETDYRSKPMPRRWKQPELI